MKDWWNSLNQREQLFVGLGGGLAFIIIFYLFIWSPFSNSVENTKSHVSYQQNLLSWMQQSSQKLLQLRNSGEELQAITSSDLLSTVDSSLHSANLNNYANGIQQTDTNKVLVKFQDIPFDYLIKWINALWTQYNIKVAEIHIKPNAHTSGVVTVNVYFTV